MVVKKIKFTWMGGFRHIIIVALHDVNPCNFRPDFRIRLYKNHENNLTRLFFLHLKA